MKYQMFKFAGGFSLFPVKKYRNKKPARSVYPANDVIAAKNRASKRQMEGLMKNFRLCAANVNVTPLLDEIAGVDGAWNDAVGRQEKIRVQREALSIPLRGLRKSAIAGRARRDVHESRWTTGSARFPLLHDFLTAFEAREGGALGRAKVVCLPAGRRVYPHIDRGEYYRIRDRYHLVLQSALGSPLKSGDEEVRMRTGELWWFDNKEVHEAFNDGDEDRIHLIFDHLPEGAASSDAPPQDAPSEDASSEDGTGRSAVGQ